MSISSISGGYGGYTLPVHGANCQCPACQQLRADASIVPAANADGAQSNSANTVSGASQSAAADKQSNPDSQNGKPAANQTQNANPAAPKAPDGTPLNDAQQKEVTELKARDTDVRRHEAAHQAAGGSLAGAASFTYEQGPDGKQYAIGGEVPIQLSRGSTPQQTIQNAETVRAAALAPADPSGQDRAVAAEAAQVEQQARQQQLTQQGGNAKLSPLEKAQKASAPEGSQTQPGQHIDTYA
ncbi:putative metalloprotease CJM1_0395 family protein [Chromobacterium amazonense]|uniref:putative metalloprotease CJM1_0395 family protein n=1 Tax=Chromobacterium amazonense TaxID=1382803 RepID=UPI003F7A679C